MSMNILATTSGRFNRKANHHWIKTLSLLDRFLDWFYVFARLYLFSVKSLA